MNKQFSKVFLSVFIATILLSCNKEPVTIPVTDLTISPGIFALNVDSTYALKISISPSSATNKTLIWESSNSDIATVDSSGLVTGIRPGTDTIKVTTKEGNATSFCIVVVIKWILYTNPRLSTGVNAIAIDPQGSMWFGTTSGGVSKFDGTTWITYDWDNSLLPNNWVTSIAIDSKGICWFGTISGLSKFDGINWTTYNTSNSGLAYNQILTIIIDEEGIKWIGTSNGISKFDDINWTTYYSDNNSGNQISSAAIDLKGNKWFGASRGIIKYDNTNWTISNKSNSGFAVDYAIAIAEDLQGYLWFGTYGEGVSKFDGVNWTTYNTMNSGLYVNMIRAIAVDKKGNKWFGTQAGGVTRFDGTYWLTFTNYDGLGWHSVLSIAIDAEDNKWFGIYNGVSKLIDH